jgi:hypothetical protein
MFVFVGNAGGELAQRAHAAPQKPPLTERRPLSLEADVPSGREEAEIPVAPAMRLRPDLARPGQNYGGELAVMMRQFQALRHIQLADPERPLWQLPPARPYSMFDVSLPKGGGKPCRKPLPVALVGAI